MKRNFLTIGVVFFTILVLGIMMYIQNGVDNLLAKEDVLKESRELKEENEDINKDYKGLLHKGFIKEEEEKKIDTKGINGEIIDQF